MDFNKLHSNLRNDYYNRVLDELHTNKNTDERYVKNKHINSKAHRDMITNSIGLMSNYNIYETPNNDDLDGLEGGSALVRYKSRLDRNREKRLLKQRKQAEAKTYLTNRRNIPQFIREKKRDRIKIQGILTNLENIITLIPSYVNPLEENVIFNAQIETQLRSSINSMLMQLIQSGVELENEDLEYAYSSLMSFIQGGNLDLINIEERETDIMVLGITRILIILKLLMITYNLDDRLRNQIIQRELNTIIKQRGYTSLKQYLDNISGDMIQRQMTQREEGDDEEDEDDEEETEQPQMTQREDVEEEKKEEVEEQEQKAQREDEIMNTVDNEVFRIVNNNFLNKRYVFLKHLKDGNIPAVRQSLNSAVSTIKNMIKNADRETTNYIKQALIRELNVGIQDKNIESSITLDTVRRADGIGFLLERK